MKVEYLKGNIASEAFSTQNRDMIEPKDYGEASLDKIYHRLEQGILYTRQAGHDMDKAVWSTEKGVLLTGNEARLLKDVIETVAKIAEIRKP